VHRARLVTVEVCHAAQVMPINPGDLACCRLGGAAGEDGPALPFTPGQDGVGLVLKARCGGRLHASGLVVLQPRRAWRVYPSDRMLSSYHTFWNLHAGESNTVHERVHRNTPPTKREDPDRPPPTPEPCALTQRGWKRITSRARQVGEGAALAEGELVMPLRPHMGTWRSLAVWRARDLLRLPPDALPARAPSPHAARLRLRPARLRCHFEVMALKGTHASFV
jgi:hypothetical protein